MNHNRNISPLDLSRGDQRFRLDSTRVIFEDEDLIAVNKPPGLPSQATLDPKRHHLAAAVADYLANKAVDDTKIYVGQHHRLDADTSGVIVFTKSKRANPALAEQVRNHKINKVYWAIVVSPARPPSKPWSVRNHLAAGPGKPMKMRSVRSGGDLAETELECLAWNTGTALIEARPRTGRMHQIRVHLAEGNRPILGDPLYADAKSRSRAPRLMLHARALSIRHPMTGEELILEAPLPEDFSSLLLALELRPPLE